MKDKVGLYDTLIEGIVENDFSLFPPVQRLAQEAVVIGQELATVALAETDAGVILGFASGKVEPDPLQMARLGLLVATSDVIRGIYDLHTARRFLVSSQPHLEDGAPVGIIATMLDDTIAPVARSIQEATWLVLE